MLGLYRRIGPVLCFFFGASVTPGVLDAEGDVLRSSREGCLSLAPLFAHVATECHHPTLVVRSLTT